MPHSTNATLATYFSHGLELGLLTEDDVRQWALTLVESQPTPPIEIIEVAMSRQREQLFETLKAVAGERDIQQSGRWLFGLLAEKLAAHPDKIKTISEKAVQIAQITDQPDNVCLQLDMLDHDIHHALNEEYVGIEECRAQLQKNLNQYSMES